MLGKRFAMNAHRGVFGPLRKRVSIRLRLSSSVPPRPFLLLDGLIPLPDDPLNLRLLLSRFIPL